MRAPVSYTHLDVYKRQGERIIRSQTPWQWGMFYLLGMGLQGKTVGIVGMGQIGVARARRGKVFGMAVV